MRGRFFLQKFFQKRLITFSLLLIGFVSESAWAYRSSFPMPLPLVPGAIDADDGDEVIGRVEYMFLADPGTGVKDTGFVELYVRDERNDRVFRFMSEDSNCAIAMAWLWPKKQHLCPREAQRSVLKKLVTGQKIRITQESVLLEASRPRVKLESTK